MTRRNTSENELVCDQDTVQLSNETVTKYLDTINTIVTFECTKLQNTVLNQLLIHAIQRHYNPNVIKYIINKMDYVRDNNILLLACQYKQPLDVLKHIVENSYDKKDMVHATDNDGNTTLMVALHNGQTADVIKWLVKPPRMFACGPNDLDAKIDALNKFNYTPLLFAIRNKYPLDVLKCLMRDDIVYLSSIVVSSIKYGLKGFNCNRLDTAFMSMLANKYPFEAIKYMVENYKECVNDEGCNSYDRYWNRSTLTIAIDNKYPVEVIKYLVEHGARTNLYSDTFVDSPLTRAIQKEYPFELLQFLVEHNRDSYGNSVAGAVLDTVNYSTGLSALSLMLKHKYSFDAIKYFVDKGADIDGHFYRDNAKTLWYALYYNHPHEVIEYLLKCGARADATNESGYTTLIVACKNKYELKTIKLLLECDEPADISVVLPITGVNVMIYATGDVREYIKSKVGALNLPKIQSYIMKV